MRKKLLVLGVVALIALAGCSGLGGDQPDVEENSDDQPEESDEPDPSSTADEGVDTDNSTTAAENVSYAVGIEVNESVAGQELDAIGATYPRENFTVEAAQHDEILLGIDTDDDGEIDRGFEEGVVSGVNNNAYSFDVTMDANYTLQTGDVVMIEYPDVNNPDEPGEYTVETRLNDQQMADATVLIE
ncbi:hypothetical protein [Halovenus sp. HT40]|uniref:hypothetical protein n=1 Tax=Halovenus sp. HT40 TaxID=3126691 RepID=UPI00300E8B90